MFAWCYFSVAGFNDAPFKNTNIFWSSLMRMVAVLLPVLMPHPSKYCFCTVSRPHDTPFEDGTFKLTLEFTEEYPNKPPTVKFVSKMFHPNVYADGGICLDILQNRWSPTYDVAAILTSIQVSVSSSPSKKCNKRGR